MFSGLVGYAVAGDVAPTSGGAYVEGVVGAPRHLNPLLARPGSPDDDLCSLIFAGLTRVLPGGEVVPDLAVEWRSSSDGRQYTFRLHPEARWHDGRPVSPVDVQATIRLLQAADFPGDPGVAAPWKGVVVEPTADGVRFSLPEPDAWFAATASIGLLPAHLVPRVSLDAEFNSRPVGAGPFRVIASDLRRVQLAAVDEHHARVPFLRTLELRFFATAEAATAALRRGELTALRPLPAIDAPPAIPDGTVAHERPERSKTVALVFNTRVPPLDDAAARATLVRALDRAALARLDPAGATPVETAAPTVAPEKEGRPIRLALVTNDRPERIAVAEEIARQFARVGAQTDVQAVGWSGMIADVLAPGRFQAALIETYDPMPASSPAPFWSAGAPLNVGGWTSRRADDALARARAAVDVASRAAALRDWRAAFDAEAPGAFLYHPRLVYVVSSQIKGQRLPPLVTPRDRFADVADWYVFTRRVPGRF